MLLLPSAIYNNADELFQEAQRLAISQGYILVKKRTQKDNSDELKNMTLRCDHDGVYYNSLDGTNHRQRTTQLIDCLFELYAARHNELWHLEIHNATHNHDHSNNITGHPIVFTNIDIYNTYAWLQLENLADYTSIWALVDELQKGKGKEDYR
ncbi:6475_t:CDS:2 [Cetraspora pellucida]|uniref:6475_t:CDS:1 n=1 Tax=Cetraspora pellucida TaxID=1433469 RepID=A0A9N9DQ80_9GLOM|nr:6475_t:CDS:2 [Cetraspora pellucida]